jgi:hypothetical protein
LAFLSLPAAAQVVLPSFTDVAITGPAFINPAITAAPGTTGINILGACPASAVSLNLDGVVVQSIRVDNSLPGGANLQLTNIQIQNLGSLPGTPALNAVNGIVVYGVTDSGATYCIATPVPSAGTVPFFSNTALGGGGVTIPAGISTINIAIQLQVANSGAYTSNVNGQTVRLRTTLTYNTTLGGVFFTQNGTSVTTAGTTFAVSLGGLEAVTDLGSTPASIAPVNTNPTITQTVDLTHNSQNAGTTTDIIDICVKNLGTGLADEDIQAIEVYDAFGHLIAAQPGSLLATALVCAGAGPAATGTFNGSAGGSGFGVSLNPGVAPLVTTTWINYLIPNGGTSRFQIVVRLRNTAVSGRTVRLQTTFVTALATTSISIPPPGPGLVVGTNAQLVNPGALPSVTMSNPVTLSNGSGILRVGDASVLQPIAGRTNPATTIVPISVSNFPSPGFGGFSGTLSFDPNVVQIAGGCNGIMGVSVQSPSAGFNYQYTVACLNVNGSTGKADFSVNFVGGTPPTGGSNPVVNVAVIATPGATAGVSSQMSLTLLSVSDANGNPVTTSTSPGVVTIRPMGDVDQNGKVEIRDAILLANAIAATCLSTPSTTVQTAPFSLSVTQLEEADVAPPFAMPRHPPIFQAADFSCSNITSADVAGIGRLALSSASASALGQAANTGSPVEDFLTGLLRWLGLMPIEGAAAPQTVVGLKTTATGSLEVTVSQLTGSAIGGLQGTLRYDPQAMQVEQIVGLSGYTVLAQAIDNANGIVRFNAIAMSGEPVQQGAVVRFELAPNSRTGSAQLGLDELVASDASALTFRIEQTKAVGLTPEVAALQVKALSVRALAEGPGVQVNVEGSGISGLELAVYDLSGRLVASEKTEGHRLVFRALAANGQPLANGVYLYTVMVHGADGQTVRTEVRKLVVLR